MNPYLAVFIYLVLLLYLLAFDRRRTGGMSTALWIPLIWFLIIGSRNLSQWLSGTPAASGMAEYYMEGSAADRILFLSLMAAGAVVLLSRRIDWRELVRENRIIVLFFLYCGLSAVWSDYSMLAFKRWVKGAGDYIMVLVVLTSAFPVESTKALIRRAAYILVPGSIIMIKYFPGGRIFTPWGQSEFVGVATSKNMLGTLYLIFGLYFLWSLLTRQHRKGLDSDRDEFYVNIAFLLMLWYLYLKAPGLTSVLCLVTGVMLLLVLRLSVIRSNPRNIGVFFLFFTFILIMLQMGANWVPRLIESFGRDPSLTGRVPLWKDLLSIKINPILGAGYESFWVGDRLLQIWNTNWWLPNQAHNGFIEVYLNLGWIGLLLIIGILFSSFRKILRDLHRNYDYGSLRMAVLFVMILYSQTEAAFKNLHKMWFLFLLMAVEYGRSRTAGEEESAGGRKP